MRRVLISMGLHSRQLASTIRGSRVGKEILPRDRDAPLVAYCSLAVSLFFFLGKNRFQVNIERLQRC